MSSLNLTLAMMRASGSLPKSPCAKIDKLKAVEETAREKRVKVERSAKKQRSKAIQKLTKKVKQEIEEIDETYGKPGKPSKCSPAKKSSQAKVADSPELRRGTRMKAKAEIKREVKQATKKAIDHEAKAAAKKAKTEIAAAKKAAKKAAKAAAKQVSAAEKPATTRIPKPKAPKMPKQPKQPRAARPDLPLPKAREEVFIADVPAANDAVNASKDAAAMAGFEAMIARTMADLQRGNTESMPRRSYY